MLLLEESNAKPSRLMLDYVFFSSVSVKWRTTRHPGPHIYLVVRFRVRLGPKFIRKCQRG